MQQVPVASQRGYLLTSMLERGKGLLNQHQAMKADHETAGEETERESCP